MAAAAYQRLAEMVGRDSGRLSNTIFKSVLKRSYTTSNSISTKIEYKPEK